MENFLDEELVEKIIKRDFVALEELFKRYEKSFYNLAYRYTGDHYSADDLASEIFLRIYRYLPTFKPNAGLFKSWAMRVGANTCLTFQTQNSKLKTQSQSLNLKSKEGEDIELEIEDKKINIEKDYEKREIEEEVQKELLKLPKKYRLAIYFYFWEDLSYDEIAKIMEIPLNTVRTNIKRGKERLEKALVDLLR